MSVRRRAVLVVAAGAMAVAAPVALAHVKVTASSPAAGATVRALPKTISATFSAVLLKVQSARLTGPDGKDHAVTVRLDPNKKNRVLVTTKNSKTGRYRLALTVVGADTHIIKGTVSFRVKK
jgi:methionine-rich copper-binding protein CopC